jgi:hypothetical protein
MSKRRIEFDSNLTAVCRRRGDGFRVAILRGNGSKTIEETFWCSPGDLRTRLETAQCGRILAILPSSASLVRTIHTPPGNPAQVEAAIRLEAEARMLGATPAHRSGISVLGRDSSHPTGLVVAWPEAIDVDFPALDPATEVRWVPEIACLAFLAGDGLDSLSAIVDADNAAIAAVIPTEHGPSFRAARNRERDTDGIESKLRPLVVESLLSEGVPPTRIESATESMFEGIQSRTIDESLVISPGADDLLRKTVKNASIAMDGSAPADDRIILAAVGVADGPLKTLAEMREFEVHERPSFVRGVANRLSEGRVAVAVGMVALILVLLVPLAGAGLRLMVMRAKVADLQILEAHVEKVDNLQKVYRELDRQAWSMTKLLGDVANLMPESIELESITIQHGEPLVIGGYAKASRDQSGADAVFDFNKRLRESGLLANSGPESSIEEPDGRGYTEFKITAEIDDALRLVRYTSDEDYAITSYSERRYGPVDSDGYLLEGDAAQAAMDARIEAGLAGIGSIPSKRPVTGSSGRSSAVADDQAPETDVAGDVQTEEPSASRTTRGSNGSTRPSSRGAGSSSRSNPSSRSAARNFVTEVPDPISPEEIATLSNAEAKDRLSKVASAKLMPGLDDETKARLRAEFTLIMARVRETSK